MRSSSFRGVLHVGEAPQQSALIRFVAADQVQDHREVRFRVTQAVNGRHGGNDDRVRALEKRLRRDRRICSMCSLTLNVLVDRRVLLYICVRRGYVCLGLVVVVVRDEIFHGVVREELAEFAVELGCQGFIVRQHHGWALHALDYLSDGERIVDKRTTPGLTEKSLAPAPRDHIRTGECS